MYICDSVGRCVGMMPVPGTPEGVPQAQIPGAWYSGPGTEPQYVILPNPLESYTVVFQAVGQGGTYHFQVAPVVDGRSEEHTSELQSQSNLVCRLLLEKKKKKKDNEESQ